MQCTGPTILGQPQRSIEQRWRTFCLRGERAMPRLASYRILSVAYLRSLLGLTALSLSTIVVAQPAQSIAAQPEATTASRAAQAYLGTVGGGLSNTVSGIAATIGGGFGNTASGYFATVGGGFGNIAAGTGS